MEALTIVPIIFTVGGALLLLVGVHGIRARARFERTAQTAGGVVTELRWEGVGHGADSSVLAFPVVRFELPDGRTVETQSTAGSYPAPAREGDAVTVRYDPADPTRASLESVLTGRGAATLSGILFIVLGGAFVAIGILVFFGGMALKDALEAA